jgi:hypothetical protein
MKKIIVALLLAALAGQASATLGSIISSFYIGKSNPESIPSYYTCIYRDPTYVYGFFIYGGQIVITVRTPTGSRVSAHPFYYEPYPYPGSMTGSHLGESYFAFSDYECERIYTTDKYGEIAGSFPAEGPGGRDPFDIMWDGRYYHVHNAEGKYNLYTTAGALAGQWTVAGWPAGMRGGGSTFSKSFNNAGGRYLFVVGPGRSDYAFNMNDGSLLASWSLPPYPYTCYGQNFGDAYPASYGGALWYHAFSNPTDEHWAYQIDVDARNATNVVPASIGKIKAIYR